MLAVVSELAEDSPIEGETGADPALVGLDTNDGGREVMPPEGLGIKEDNLFCDLIALALSLLIGVKGRDAGVACRVVDVEEVGEEEESGRDGDGKDVASRSRLNKPKRLCGISAVCTSACTITSVPGGGNCCWFSFWFWVGREGGGAFETDG